MRLPKGVLGPAIRLLKGVLGPAIRLPKGSGGPAIRLPKGVKRVLGPAIRLPKGCLGPMKVMTSAHACDIPVDLHCARPTRALHVYSNLSSSHTIILSDALLTSALVIPVLLQAQSLSSGNCKQHHQDIRNLAENVSAAGHLQKLRSMHATIALCPCASAMAFHGETILPRRGVTLRATKGAEGNGCTIVTYLVRVSLATETDLLYKGTHAFVLLGCQNFGLLKLLFAMHSPTRIACDLHWRHFWRRLTGPLLRGDNVWSLPGLLLACKSGLSVQTVTINQSSTGTRSAAYCSMSDETGGSWPAQPDLAMATSS